MTATVAPIRLTPPQRRALRIIISHVEEHGCPPTLTELAQQLGGISKTAAKWRVDKLKEKGALTRATAVPRGIEVVEGIEIEREEDLW